MIQYFDCSLFIGKLTNVSSIRIIAGAGFKLKIILIIFPFPPSHLDYTHTQLEPPLVQALWCRLWCKMRQNFVAGHLALLTLWLLHLSIDSQYWTKNWKKSSNRSFESQVYCIFSLPKLYNKIPTISWWSQSITLHRISLSLSDYLLLQKIQRNII